MKILASILIAVGAMIAVTILIVMKNVGAALQFGGELVLVGFCLRGLVRDAVTPPPPWRERALNVILVVALGIGLLEFVVGNPGWERVVSDVFHGGWVVAMCLVAIPWRSRVASRA
jgi:hypothetical protein